jgi:hypothetical protein
MKYRDMNKEQKKAYHKAYYESHKEEAKKKSSISYYANHEKNKQNRRDYHKKNRDVMTAKVRIYYHAHKEENKPNRKAYNMAHKKESKDRSLKRCYGISLQEYEDMCASQKDLCATCEMQENLVVDHDHATGKIRKLLCKKCNLALGYVKDNPITLKNMIEYLKENS